MPDEASLRTDVDFPMYVVADEESGEALVTAEEVEGFFVDPLESAPKVVFLRARVNGSRRKTENAVLNIMNRRNEKVGEYLVGRVMLGEVGRGSTSAKVSSVSCKTFDNRCEYPEAAKIWQRWASGAEVAKGEWFQRSASDHSAWLHVVQNSWFATNHKAARYGVDKVVYLDGAHITTRAGFFCEVGEAVNGPGGYFGSNLDALAECLSASSEELSLAKIVWKNFQTSQQSLDPIFLGSAIGVMQEYGVEVAKS